MLVLGMSSWAVVGGDRSETTANGLVGGVRGGFGFVGGLSQAFGEPLRTISLEVLAGGLSSWMVGVPSVLAERTARPSRTASLEACVTGFSSWKAAVDRQMENHRKQLH